MARRPPALRRALRLLPLAVALAAVTGLPAPEAPVPEAPAPPEPTERLLAKLRQRATAAAAAPYDRPDLAQEHYRAKRLGSSRLRVAPIYDRARRKMDEMPLYSTPRGRFLPRGEEEPFLHKASVGTTLDDWQALGPGNIGGRTRAFAIHPGRRAVMWAGGVSGGIWKTTNRGATWRPVGDELTNLAINVLELDPRDPDTLYAGTGEGYFREAVRGTALPLRGGGIFKSVDGGESWERMPGTEQGRFHFVNDLVVSHNDSERIYAATRFGILRTIDGGESWKRVLDPRVKGGCLDLVERTDRNRDFLLASCGTLVPGAVYRNLQAETDRAWEKVLAEPGMARTSLAIAPSSQNVVYALAASSVPGPQGRFEQALHAVYRSNAGGAAGSWRTTVTSADPNKVNTLLLSNPITASLVECGFDDANDYFAMGWYVNVIAVDPGDPDRVWAGGVDIFRSDDGGRNWRPASYWWADDTNPGYAHADQHALVFDPHNRAVLYLLNDGGIFRTPNARAALTNRSDALCAPGASSLRWESLNRSYGVTQFYHGSVFPGGRRYLGGTQDNGTLVGRPSTGENGWQEILGGDGGYSAIDPNDARFVYASFQGAQVRRSITGGSTWQLATNGLFDLGGGDDFTARPDNYLFITPFIMDPNNSLRLWIGGRRVFRTDDGAAFWNAASTPLAGGGKVSALAVAPGRPDRVLAGTTAGSIFRTEIGLLADGETEWERSRPRGGWVSWLAFDPSDADVAYATYARFGGRHVWKSEDGGTSWRPLDGSGPEGLPNLPVHSLAVDPRNGERIYLGTDLGVFVTLDGGASWAVENTGFAAAVTETLVIAPDPPRAPWLFAFTHGRGVWRVRLD